jgi:hypothetical protein
VNSALPSSLLLLLFFLPFTWGRYRRARATTALPRATSLELLILFGITEKYYDYQTENTIVGIDYLFLHLQP